MNLSTSRIAWYFFGYWTLRVLSLFEWRQSVFRGWHILCLEDQSTYKLIYSPADLESAYALDPPAPAEQRAYEMFLSYLNPAQRRDWGTSGIITVTSSRGRWYSLSRCTGGPGAVLKDAEDYYAYCTSIRGWRRLPLYDHYLAQLLQLRADVQGFHERAW